jgi:hypothetical protein
MNVTEWENTANLVVEWTLYYRRYAYFDLCDKTPFCQRPKGHPSYCFPDPPSDEPPQDLRILGGE